MFEMTIEKKVQKWFHIDFGHLTQEIQYKSVSTLFPLNLQMEDAVPIPVMLFIHGGSNRVGMGAMLQGDVLAGYGKIVVVNFNYRLGPLGKQI